jgi:hypothetical protein
MEVACTLTSYQSAALSQESRCGRCALDSLNGLKGPVSPYSLFPKLV